MDYFNGKVVWITGASSGIGEALALALAQRGASLALSGRNQDRLDKLKEQCEAHHVTVHTFPFDLGANDRVHEQVNQVISCFGRVDILLNNAGISQRSLVHETPLHVDRRIMEVNYFSNIALTKALLPYMIKQGHGHIAVTTSIVGHFGFPLRSAYAASKHALIGFYTSLQTEMDRSRIDISLITPGRIKTSISLHALNNKGEEQGVMDPGQEQGMPADQCARKILKGLTRRKREIFVGGKELWMVRVHKYIPGLFHYLVRRISHV